MIRSMRYFRAALVFAAVVLVVGCVAQEDKSGPAKDAARSDSKHNTWWCEEHGVPEAECSMCTDKARKAFKAKGDWCKEHDRAKSQCFICDPSLKEKYAAVYRAKYGTEPPLPTDNMRKDEDKK
jgi:hypothetical protein